jgi:hypothetical protein
MDRLSSAHSRPLQSHTLQRLSLPHSGSERCQCAGVSLRTGLLWVMGVGLLLALLRLPGRALDPPAHHEPDREHFRDRPPTSTCHQGSRLPSRWHRDGVQADRIRPNPMAHGQRTPPGSPRPRRRPLHQRQTGRTIRPIEHRTERRVTRLSTGLDNSSLATWSDDLVSGLTTRNCTRGKRPQRPARPGSRDSRWLSGHRDVQHERPVHNFSPPNGSVSSWSGYLPHRK